MESLFLKDQTVLSEPQIFHPPCKELLERYPALQKSLQVEENSWDDADGWEDRENWGDEGWSEHID